MSKEQVKRVIYSEPMTIVFWGDGTKTMARCDEVDHYDELTGFLMCVFKRMMPPKLMRQMLSTFVYGDNPKYIKRIVPKKEREAQKVRFIGAKRNNPIEFTVDAFVDPNLVTEYSRNKSAEDFVDMLDNLLEIFSEE